METAKLYVGNLPFSATDEDVRSLFGKAGEVQEVRLISDRETGRSKGYAFITFVDKTGATAALEQFNDYEYEGRKLKVDRARENAGGGGGGRGGRRSGGRERQY